MTQQITLEDLKSSVKEEITRTDDSTLYNKEVESFEEGITDSAYTQDELECRLRDSTLYNKEVESFEEGRTDSAYTQDEFECRLRGQELNQNKNIIDDRKKYADKIFVLVITWLVVVGLILCLHGSIQACTGKVFLSDNVLITLIGGTTLNVIGIFTIVANFLFPKNGHSLFSREQLKKKTKIKKEKKSDAINLKRI